MRRVGSHHHQRLLGLALSWQPRVETSLVPKMCVMQHCRNFNFNPWRWKNDPKATPKQQEISRLLGSSTPRQDIYTTMKDPNLKLFPAPTDVLPISEADIVLFCHIFVDDRRAFPDNKPVLVCISLRPNIALDMADSWLTHFHAKFPDLKTYNVTLLTNPGYKILGPLLQINLRNVVPPARWPYEGVHYAPVSYFSVDKSLTDLGLIGTNVFAAYVYVVHQGLIRWKAVGMATETELNYLNFVVNKLQGVTVKPPTLTNPATPAPTPSTTPPSSPPPPPSSPPSPPRK